MDDEQIRKMEVGRELDALVGVEIFDASQWCPEDPDDPMCRCERGQPHTIHFRDSLPEFSDDIAFMPLLHERIKALNLWVKFTQALCVIFLHDGAAEHMPPGEEPLWWAFVTATPHEQCRAALLAKRAS